MEGLVKQLLMKDEYEMAFRSKVDTLVQKRKTMHISQLEIARRAKVSRRKIIMFEGHDCDDAYLLFAYKRILTTK